MNTLQRFEVWVSVLMMLICAVFLWESWDLPPGTFEPLGSGPVPKATAFVIIFCCIWVIISSLKNSPVTEESESDEGGPSINAGLLIFFTTVLYTVFLQFRVMPFSWMTTLFLFFTIWGLERFSRKKMLPAFKLGLGGRIGSGNQRTGWISIEDLIGIIDAALQDERWRGAVNAVASKPASNRELTKQLARVLCRPAIFPIPALIVRILFGEMANDTVLADLPVHSRRLIELGYELRHPELEAALNHLLAK